MLLSFAKLEINGVSFRTDIGHHGRITVKPFIDDEFIQQLIQLLQEGENSTEDMIEGDNAFPSDNKFRSRIDLKYDSKTRWEKLLYLDESLAKSIVAALESQDQFTFFALCDIALGTKCGCLSYES